MYLGHKSIRVKGESSPRNEQEVISIFNDESQGQTKAHLAIKIAILHKPRSLWQVGMELHSENTCLLQIFSADKKIFMMLQELFDWLWLLLLLFLSRQFPS